MRESDISQIRNGGIFSCQTGELEVRHGRSGALPIAEAVGAVLYLGLGLERVETIVDIAGGVQVL